jgi:hypothetical protein
VQLKDYYFFVVTIFYMLRLLAATFTVVITTADDAVWLVPYVTSPQLSTQCRLVHALIFVGTLEFMVLVCVVIATTVGSVVPPNKDYILSMIGAILCWGIALFLILRKLQKRRKQQQYQKIGEETLRPSSIMDDGSAESPKFVPSYEDDGSSYDSVITTSNNEVNLSFSPTLVASLTVLGSLDEVSYFPGLLVGHVFSPFDLCLGTALAATIIVVLISFCLTHCRPLLECLDRIPLHGVLCGFATLLTVVS